MLISATICPDAPSSILSWTMWLTFIPPSREWVTESGLHSYRKIQGFLELLYIMVCVQYPWCVLNASTSLKPVTYPGIYPYFWYRDSSVWY